MVGQVLQAGVNVEFDDHVAYELYAVEGGGSANNRNGSYAKTVRAEIGQVEVHMPRDRLGTFQPVTVAMEYHGGFRKIADRGRELAGAGDIARDWARAIEAEHKTTGANPPASDSCTAEDAASPCAPTPARPAVSGSRARKAG